MSSYIRVCFESVRFECVEGDLVVWLSMAVSACDAVAARTAARVALGQVKVKVKVHTNVELNDRSNNTATYT